MLLTFTVIATLPVLIPFEIKGVVSILMRFEAAPIIRTEELFLCQRLSSFSAEIDLRLRARSWPAHSTNCVTLDQWGLVRVMLEFEFKKLTFEAKLADYVDHAHSKSITEASLLVSHRQKGAGGMNRLGVLSTSALALLALGGLPLPTDNHPGSVSLSAAAATPDRRSAAYPTRLLWGDTHLHTDFSMDAATFGAKLSPDDAYRFAMGEEVTASNGMKAKLAAPLDFLMVSDHSDNLGSILELQEHIPS